MKIECPSCAAKYSIGDDKVQDRLAKIRCRKCGTTIVIDGKQNPPHIYAAEAGSSTADSVVGGAAQGAVGTAASSSAASDGEFTVDFGDGDQRSLTLAQVVQAYNKGEVTAEHYVWADGFDDWRPLGEVDSIVQTLQRGASAAAPAAAPRAAAVGGKRGGDLFGRIDQAGSEEDVTTSAHSPDPMPAGAAATGARNESSVLFSLSALTSAAATTKSSGAGGLSGLSTGPTNFSSGKEDSGLIDLKALTAAAASDDAKRDAAPVGFGMAPAPFGGLAAAPLGMAPPFGGAPSTSPALAFDPGPMPQKNRTGLFIGGGIAVAAVAFAAIVITSREEPAPIPSATVMAAPAPTPTPTPTPTQESTAQAPATGAAEEDAGPPEEEAKKPVARRTWRPRKQAGTDSQASKTSTAAAAPKAKPKPKSTSKCGCAPGNLQCAMRCAAGG